MASSATNKTVIFISRLIIFISRLNMVDYMRSVNTCILSPFLNENECSDNVLVAGTPIATYATPRRTVVFVLQKTVCK